MPLKINLFSSDVESNTLKCIEVQLEILLLVDTCIIIVRVHVPDFVSCTLFPSSYCYSCCCLVALNVTMPRD